MINNSGKGEKRVMIILDLNVLAPGSQVGQKIGHPVPYVEGGSETCAQSAKPPPMPQQQVVSNKVGLRIKSTLVIVRNKAVSPFSAVPLYKFTIHGIFEFDSGRIKARVTLKTPIKTWSNARGEGKLFSLNLVDESGEIRATAFNESVDKFYESLEMNKVYYFSNYSVKPANKNFSNVNHDYEITFNSSTQVSPCLNDSDVPTTQFNFIPINKIAENDPTSYVDVIGVCKNVGDVVTFTARTTNKELKKRDITLVDQSNTSVSLTLWGSQAEEFDDTNQPVIAVKAGRINEFGGGRSVSMTQASIMLVNPDIPEAHRLKGWFDNHGVTQETVNISARTGTGGVGFDGNWMSFKEVHDAQLGGGDKPDYFNCKATVLLVRSENATYRACPQVDCNKKVVDMGNDMYRCEKCQAEYPNFKYRLLLSMCLGDWTSNQWVTCFQEVAEEILGVTAQEVGTAENTDQNMYNSFFKNATFKSFIFKLRAKMEFYNDERRLKVTIAQVKPINFKEYNTTLMDNIKKLSDIDFTKESIYLLILAVCSTVDEQKEALIDSTVIVRHFVKEENSFLASDGAAIKSSCGWYRNRKFSLALSCTQLTGTSAEKLLLLGSSFRSPDAGSVCERDGPPEPSRSHCTATRDVHWAISSSSLAWNRNSAPLASLRQNTCSNMPLEK
uniref:Replication protein A subunit n=1 Tax=Timema tahoe TaxID=61484 RepID=A0A7R9IJN7_9NEOP|nr:unnamed protein product [Timema tahoe]